MKLSTTAWLLATFLVQGSCASVGHVDMRDTAIIELEHEISVDGVADVNINKLVQGPRDYIYGSTEENGYLFILDPVSNDFLIFDAGRTSENRLESKYGFSGDITDFVVYENDDSIFVVALQAYPAEIYEITIDVKRGEFPQKKNVSQRKIFESQNHDRFMAIDRSDEGVILAGTYGPAELFVSYDDGESWSNKSMMTLLSSTELGGRELDVIERKISWASSINEIYVLNGRWFVSLYHFFLLDKDMPWKTGYRHFHNALVYSDNLEKWSFSIIERDADIYEEKSEAIVTDSFYDMYRSGLLGGLIGEVAQTITLDSKRDRLYFSTGMDNDPAPPYGGRVMVSHDQGETWREAFSLESTDTVMGFAEEGVLGVGSFTKISREELLKSGKSVAEAGFYICSERIGCEYKKVVQTESPSTFRENVFVIGVSAMVRLPDALLVGTVDESSRARLYIIKP